MKPAIKHTLTEEDSDPAFGLSSLTEDGDISEKKTVNYSKIKPIKISKKANMINFANRHKDLVSKSGFPKDILVYNSAVNAKTTDPGKYYLEFAVNKPLTVEQLPDLKKAIKKYIAAFFNLDEASLDKKLANEDAIKVFNVDDDTSKYYVDFIITESKSDDNKVEKLIECVTNKQFDSADELLTEIIKSKIVSKIHSIIKY